MQCQSRVPVLESREVPFIKHSTFSNDNAFGERIEEPPTLVAVWIAQEDAFIHVGAQSTAFVLLHMNISQRAKDAQVGYVRFHPKPSFIWGCTRSCRARSSIKNIDQAASEIIRCVKKLTPKNNSNDSVQGISR